jgi:DNA repair protein RecO (recombination protein O)
MPSHLFQGIILKHKDLGESDRILWIFTRTRGKVLARARGARRSRKRFANALERFNCIRGTFFEKPNQDWMRLDTCDIQATYPGLRLELRRMALASEVLELTEVLFPLKVPQEKVYQMLTDFLGLMEKEANYEPLSHGALLKLLDSGGYRPSLGKCRGCQKPLAEVSEPHFIPASGGILCLTCRGPESAGVTVNKGVLNYLKTLMDLPLHQAPRHHPPQEAPEKARILLETYIQFLLGRNLSSTEFLKKCSGY